MSPERVFTLANLVAVFGWLLLAALPRQRWLADVVCGWLLPALLASLYLVILGTSWSGHRGGFSSLHEVALLFENPWLLLAGWVHYLAFDLFVGSWIVRDARARGIRHMFLLPSLLFTFLFGPAGWLSYLVLRAGLARRQPRVSGPAPSPPPGTAGAHPCTASASTGANPPAAARSGKTADTR